MVFRRMKKRDDEPTGSPSPIIRHEPRTTDFQAASTDDERVRETVETHLEQVLGPIGSRPTSADRSGCSSPAG